MTSLCWNVIGSFCKWSTPLLPSAGIFLREWDWVGFGEHQRRLRVLFNASFMSYGFFWVHPSNFKFSHQFLPLSLRYHFMHFKSILRYHFIHFKSNVEETFFLIYLKKFMCDNCSHYNKDLFLSNMPYFRIFSLLRKNWRFYHLVLWLFW